ncbi:hypothetical protein ACVJGD_000510 [Bradyrhizobium sp. USDA 10063]
MLVYYIPQCKADLVLRCSTRPCGSPAVTAISENRKHNKKRPAAGRALDINCVARSYVALDFSTTTLRHGFNTMMASSDARMLAPAAMRKTLSQLPAVCCT